MKSLEHKAEKYDKGIKLITLGKLPKIKRFIVDSYLNKGEKILDIGMGTGTFAILAAQKGVRVTGIDISERMLEVAKNKIAQENLTEKIEIIKMHIIDMDENFQNKSFDKVVATLSFSELYQKEQEFCLTQINRVLKNNGELVILDEVKPKNIWKKIMYFFVRIPLAFINFLKAHVSTSSLKNFDEKLEANNFLILEEHLYLLDTLKLIRAKKAEN
jgi:demethylmenaquinone methyltransferase/2-methoxy-6-polyprenyl-1,4-benzoquinol methylase